MNIWRCFLLLLKVGRFSELPGLWSSAVTAALFSAWYFPGWAVMLGASHGWYARHHYFMPVLGLAFVSIGCGFFLEGALFGKAASSPKVKKLCAPLIGLGLTWCLLGILVALFKGEGAAFFAILFVIVSLFRMKSWMGRIMDALLSSVAVVLIYLAIVFKYQIPNLEGLLNDNGSTAKDSLWIYLISIFLFHFACQLIPYQTGKAKVLSLLLIAQPVVIVPILLTWQWQWFPAFLIPMTLFAIWFGFVVRRNQVERERPDALVQAGRPLVDFLLLGSVGMALFFKWSGEVTIFNSYTIRTLLLFAPAYFLAGWILAWLRPKALDSFPEEERSLL